MIGGGGQDDEDLEDSGFFTNQFDYMQSNKSGLKQLKIYLMVILNKKGKHSFMMEKHDIGLKSRETHAVL